MSALRTTLSLFALAGLSGLAGLTGWLLVNSYSGENVPPRWPLTQGPQGKEGRPPAGVVTLSPAEVPRPFLSEEPPRRVTEGEFQIILTRLREWERRGTSTLDSRGFSTPRPDYVAYIMDLITRLEVSREMGKLLAIAAADGLAFKKGGWREIPPDSFFSAPREIYLALTPRLRDPANTVLRRRLAEGGHLPADFYEPAGEGCSPAEYGELFLLIKDQARRLAFAAAHGRSMLGEDAPRAVAFFTEVTAREQGDATGQNPARDALCEFFRNLWPGVNYAAIAEALPSGKDSIRSLARGRVVLDWSDSDPAAVAAWIPAHQDRISPEDLVAEVSLWERGKLISLPSGILKLPPGPYYDAAADCFLQQAERRSPDYVDSLAIELAPRLTNPVLRSRWSADSSDSKTQTPK